MSSNTWPEAIELQKCLEEAGMYEENMDQTEMLTIYNAIKSSESTAQEENEQRSIIETAEKNCKVVETLKEENKSITSVEPLENKDKKDTGSVENPVEDVKVKPSTPKLASYQKVFVPKVWSNEAVSCEVRLNEPDKTKTTKKVVDDDVNIPEEELTDINIDVFSCPPVRHKPLDIIVHKPKYTPPVYCDPKTLNLSFKGRATVIYNFHQSLLEKFYNLHCQSLNPAPWGKPITMNAKHNGCLDRKIYKFSKECDLESYDDPLDPPMETSENSEIYTSRSGRQTKRKVYVEDEEEKSKKAKKDQDNDEFELVTKPPPKRQNISKLSTPDIMKRSKIFANNSTPSRSEKLFDQLVDTDKKKRQLEKDIDQFKNNLSDDNDDDEVIPSSQGNNSPESPEIKPAEITYYRRRVAPSLHGRKPINNRKCISEKEKNKATKSNDIGKGQSQSQEISSTGSSSAKTEAKPTSQAKTQPKKQNPPKGKTQCPICSEVFFQDEIEEHASSCGVGMETESNFETISLSSPKTIMCNVCDRVMPMNTEYEVHVKDCVAKASSEK